MEFRCSCPKWFLFSHLTFRMQPTASEPARGKKSSPHFPRDRVSKVPHCLALLVLKKAIFKLVWGVRQYIKRRIRRSRVYPVLSEFQTNLIKKRALLAQKKKYRGSSKGTFMVCVTEVQLDSIKDNLEVIRNNSFKKYLFWKILEIFTTPTYELKYLPRLSFIIFDSKLGPALLVATRCIHPSQ